MVVSRYPLPALCALHCFAVAFHLVNSATSNRKVTVTHHAVGICHSFLLPFKWIYSSSPATFSLSAAASYDLALCLTRTQMQT